MLVKLAAVLPRGLRARLALAFSLLSVILTPALVGLVELGAVRQREDRIGASQATQTSEKLERGTFGRYREVALPADRASLSDPGYDAARLSAAVLRQGAGRGKPGADAVRSGPASATNALGTPNKRAARRLMR